jgi:hypothetical protein
MKWRGPRRRTLQREQAAGLSSASTSWAIGRRRARGGGPTPIGIACAEGLSSRASLCTARDRSRLAGASPVRSPRNCGASNPGLRPIRECAPTGRVPHRAPAVTPKRSKRHSKWPTRHVVVPAACRINQEARRMQSHETPNGSAGRLPATACWLRVACPAHSQVTRRQDPGLHSTLLLKWHIA